MAVAIVGLSIVACSAAPVPVGSGCAPGGATLPDGRWFVMVHQVLGRYLNVDVACFYSGADATAARNTYGFPYGPNTTWAPKGYFIYNATGMRRDVPVAAGATLTMRNMTANPDPATVSLPTFAANTQIAASYYPAWITTKGGAITSLMTTWFSTPAPTPRAGGCSVTSAALPTGHFFVNVTAITASTVSMDLVCRYVGDDANNAALRHNRRGDQELAVPNDAFTVNPDPTIRRMSTTNSTAFYGLWGPTPVRMARADLWTTNQSRSFLALVTISGGKVQEVRQQYVP